MTWRPLAFLGRHSLPVVAVQSVAVMMMLQFDRLSATATARTLTALSALALIFLAAACNERWNRSRKQGAPNGATGSLVGDPNSAAAVAAPEDIRAA